MTTSESTGAPAYGPELLEEVLGSFSGSIRPVAVSAIYRVTLLLVALTMVVLPIIYVCMSIAVAYGVYYHAIHDLTWFKVIRPARFAAVAYVTPLFVGGTLVLFMFKPLFARQPKKAPPRSLLRDDEPILFSFVDKVCETVGAAKPRRIDVDGQVNASASFRRAVLSFVGSDLVLTIGLPLVGGLSLRQFAGILAHELGHFSQGAGMRLSYLIRSINHWFLRVVYARDRWDESLDRTAESGGHWAVTLMANASRFFVWLTRRILWVLMWIGHAVSSFQLRQMEFDADRYEARLVGASTFASTCNELRNLSLAYQWSLSDLSSAWREGKLAEDLPDLVRVTRARLPNDLLEKVRAGIAEEKTGLFDSHPADGDRIESAAREGEHAVFRSELSASILFRDFDALSRLVSLDFYSTSIGDAAKRAQLVPLSELLEDKRAREASHRAASRVLQGACNAVRPIVVPRIGDDASPDVETARLSLEAARRTLEKGSAEFARGLSAWSENEGRLINARQAGALVNAGVAFEAESFGLSSADLPGVILLEGRCNSRRAELDSPLTSFEIVALRRLQVALGVLQLPGLEITDRAALTEEINGLQLAASTLATVFEPLRELRIEFAVVGAVASVLGRVVAKEGIEAELSERLLRIQSCLVDIRDGTRDVENPLAAASPRDLGGFLVPGDPTGEGVTEVLSLAQATLERLPDLYLRILARLALLAEELEGRLGFEQLAEPGSRG